MSQNYKFEIGQLVTAITNDFNCNMFDGFSKPWDSTDSMLATGPKIKGGQLVLVINRNIFDVIQPVVPFYKVLTLQGIGWVHEKWIKKC